MKSIFGALLALSITLGGCAFVQENESTARLATTYATLKIIDEDSEKAARVEAIATEVKRYASDDPAVTVDALIVLARSLVRWDRLDVPDRLLVDALLLEISARLKDMLGEDVIPEDARVTVETVAGWIIDAAGTVAPT